MKVGSAQNLLLCSFLLLFVFTNNVLGQWQIEMIDDRGTSDGEPGDLSIAFDSHNKAHIIMLDADKDLLYIHWNGNNWQKDIIDFQGWVGAANSIDIDSQDHPHISYLDISNDNLKYAHWTGSNWNIEVVDQITKFDQCSSIVVDSNNLPHISYYDSENRNLNYAYYNGNQWQITVVDSLDDVGIFNSIDLDSDEHPHIAYVDSDHRSLKYAFNDGNGWQIEVIENNDNEPITECISYKIDTNDHDHVVFFNYYTHRLRYGYRGTNGWIFSTIDNETYSGRYVSLVLDQCNHPHISYQSDYVNWYNSRPRYANWNGVSWHIDICDDDSNGNDCVIAVDKNGHPYVVYNHDANEIRLAKNLAFTSVGTEIWMPKDYYHPGESCECVAKLCNPSNYEAIQTNLFVILGILGTYYFWPDFGTELSFAPIDLSPGLRIETIIPKFIWPAGTGHLEGVIWYGAITDKEITYVIGDVGIFEFGWGV